MKKSCRGVVSIVGLLTLITLSLFVGLPGCNYGDSDDDDDTLTKLVGNYLYVVEGPAAGSGPGSVSSFKNDKDGNLTELKNSPLPTGGQLSVTSSEIGIDVTPNHKFMYVSNNTSSSVAGFKIGYAGKLYPLSGATVSTSSNPRAIRVHPSGEFLFVGNANDEIEVFSINKNSGALTEVTGSPFTVGDSLRAIAIHPDGEFLYTGHMFGVNEGLEAYTIDQDTGAITFSGATSLSGSSRPGESIFITPDGSRLICTDLDSGIYIADINDATGALTLVPTAPQNVVGFISSAALNRAGDRLYLYESPNIYGYSISAAGELTALPNMPYTNAGNQFYTIRTDEFDQFLFAVSVADDQVHVFEILDDGSLQEHIESPIANANPAGVPVQLINVP